MTQHPVDSILDGWFGEPAEHAENQGRLEGLYKPLRELFSAPAKPITVDLAVVLGQLQDSPDLASAINHLVAPTVAEAMEADAAEIERLRHRVQELLEANTEYLERARRAEAVEPSKQFEYKAHRVGLHTDQIADRLERFNADGWEVMSIQCIDQQYAQSLGSYLIVLRRQRS